MAQTILLTSNKRAIQSASKTKIEFWVLSTGRLCSKHLCSAQAASRKWIHPDDDKRTDITALEFRNVAIWTIHNIASFLFINSLPKSQEALHEWPPGDETKTESLHWELDITQYPDWAGYLYKDPRLWQRPWEPGSRRGLWVGAGSLSWTCALCLLPLAHFLLLFSLGGVPLHPHWNVLPLHPGSPAHVFIHSSS